MLSRSLSLFGTETAERTLRQHCLASLDQIFAAGSTAELRHHGRSVWKTELRESDGRLFTAYLKLSWGRRRLWPRMTDLRNGQVLQSLAFREWNGLAALERHGFLVPERLALLEDGWLWKRSAVILRAVRPKASISEMLQTGDWARLSADQRANILRKAITILADIHAAGLGWRGASSRHMFPECDRTGQWSLWLIDCEGVHRARTAAIFNRDVDRFTRSFRSDGADADSLDLVREFTREINLARHSSASADRARRAA